MAAEELFRVRTGFIETVSKPLIKELLGGLLTDGIISEMENETILEEHSTRADKAAALIDTVRKKGDEASEKMIAHLKKKDPMVHAKLGLGCAQPVPMELQLQQLH